MRKFTLENAMIKAIQEFKRVNKNTKNSIRNIYALEWCDGANPNALFNIEFADQNGDYYDFEIQVYTDRTELRKIKSQYTTI